MSGAEENGSRGRTDREGATRERVGGNVAEEGAARSRLAVYFVPGDGTPLARFGHGVLGRDALARPVPPHAGVPTVPDAWIAAPARYGFHATLKAPFHLAADVAELDLVEACAALGRAHAPCPLTGLAVGRPGGFAALVQPGSDAAVDALAADAVIGLEPFRAPLDAAAFARRRPATLSPAARARLESWGYPHVLDGFRFHMTLSSSLTGTGRAGVAGDTSDDTSGGANGRGSEASGEAGDPAATLAGRWLAALATRFEEIVPEVPLLDRIALCRQTAPDAPFVRIAEFPLAG